MQKWVWWFIGVFIFGGIYILPMIVNYLDSAQSVNEVILQNLQLYDDLYMQNVNLYYEQVIELDILKQSYIHIFENLETVDSRLILETFLDNEEIISNNTINKMYYFLNEELDIEITKGELSNIIKYFERISKY